MRGLAVQIGPAGPAWHAGSLLFQLFPSMGQDEGQDDFVVVACTPAAVDHGQPETTIFKTDIQGRTERFGGLDHGAEALTLRHRIVGRHDADAALANLQGGYFAVTWLELEGLRPGAIESARKYAAESLSLGDADARDYAHNNWGMFAAQALDASATRPSMMSSTNHVFS
jgi:hypothetical protein